MWPLTLFHIPTSRIGWIVCIADKRSANYEYRVDRMIEKDKKRILKLRKKQQKRP